MVVEKLFFQELYTSLSQEREIQTWQKMVEVSYRRKVKLLMSTCFVHRGKHTYLLCYLSCDVLTQISEELTFQPAWAKNEQGTVLYTMAAGLAHSYDAWFMFHEMSCQT